MTINETDIRARLDLDPPEAYRFTAIREHLDPHRLRVISPEKMGDALFRKTGRSTQMLVKAMVQLSAGKTILIKAETKEMEDRIYDRAQHMACNLGLAPHLVVRHRDWLKKWHVAEDHPLP